MTVYSIGAMVLRRRRWIAWLGLFVWAGLIFGLSSQSRPLGRSLASEWLWGHADLGAHFGEYFILALLAYFAIANKGSMGQGFIHYLVVFVGASIIGGLTEVYQGFVPGRTPSLIDLFADVSGALSALILVAILSRGRVRSMALRVGWR